MSSVITQTPMPDPNAVARPLLVLGYETEWTAGNTLHDIVGTNIPVPTLRGASTRTGSLSMLFATEATARAAAELFCRPSRFALTDTDRTSINMTFVASGSISLTLDPETLAYWILDVDYTEVLPV
jgi:hypothetical protein